MNDPTTSQGEVGLDRVQLPLGYRQCARIATEDRPFVEQPGPFDSWRATWSHFRRQTAHLEWVDGDELEEIRRHQQALVGALIGNYATLLRQVDEQGPAQGGPAQGGADDSGAITALEGLDEHTDR